MSFKLDRLANQLDWNLLRTFMVIVQERSITAAALRLNVTQPSVSAALRRLEERLGFQLVERGAGRAFRVTASGEMVYREALEMYGGVVRLNELGESDEQVLNGNIVIYRSSHLDFQRISNALAEFQYAHPGVTYSLVSSSCGDVVRALQQRVASLGFCTRLEYLPQFTRHKLETQEFAFYCGPKHPMYQVADPDPDIIAHSSIVGFEGETLTGALSQITRFRVRNEIGDNVLATTSSIVDLVDLIEHMPAIGCMAIGHADRLGDRLWRIPIDGASLHVDMHALVDGDRQVTPPERALSAYLHSRGFFE